MKIKSIAAAAGAMGVGLGIAGFIGGTGTASAACGDDHPHPRLERVNCLVNRAIAAFGDSVDPRHQPSDRTFLNGTPDRQRLRQPGPRRDQPNTFVNSIVGSRHTGRLPRRTHAPRGSLSTDF